MSSNGGVRVKTLDKKEPKLGTSFLFAGALVLLITVTIGLWGALVMFITEYLEKMGLIETALDYSESLGFGVLTLAAVNIISMVWNGSVKS